MAKLSSTHACAVRNDAWEHVSHHNSPPTQICPRICMTLVRLYIYIVTVCVSAASNTFGTRPTCTSISIHIYWMYIYGTMQLMPANFRNGGVEFAVAALVAVAVAAVAVAALWLWRLCGWAAAADSCGCGCGGCSYGCGCCGCGCGSCGNQTRRPSGKKPPQLPNRDGH